MKLIWEHLWTCIPSYSKYHVHEGVHDWKHMLPQCVEIIFCYFNTYNKKNSYPFYFFRILNFPYSYSYTHSLTQLSLSLYYCHILSNKPCKTQWSTPTITCIPQLIYKPFLRQFIPSKFQEKIFDTLLWN